MNNPHFAGECWLESRNTLYRFRDGACIAVGCENARKARARREPLVGMRLVGWIAGSAERAVFTYEWQAGACAVLWREAASRGGARPWR